MPSFDIAPNHLKIVHEILNLNLPSFSKVCVFGSRSQKAQKKYSDLDLAIDYNGQKIPTTTLIALREAFDESDLPYKVDIVDWNTLSDRFKQSIQVNRILLRG